MRSTIVGSTRNERVRRICGEIEYRALVGCGMDRSDSAEYGVVMEPCYYINLFTPETWHEAGRHDYTVTGFSERRLAYASRIKPGDIFLCYLTGKSRFIGALRATSNVFTDTSPIWKSQPFPTRFSCEPIVAVPEDRGVHLREVQQRSPQPSTYNWIFRASPQAMPADDSKWILERLKAIARETPASRPVQLEVGTDEEREATANATHGHQTPEKAERAHPRIQYLLTRLGRDMGLRVWVARNDQGTVYDGHRLGDLSVGELPFNYDSTTQGTIERIDVLWLKRNRIEAAFEIESTTSIHSGLLRMSDLLAMQPNIDIPLYIVAPEARRHLVHREIRRPTFARLETPLHDVCRYLPFGALEKALDHHGDAVKYMRPDFLDSIAERVG